MIDIINQIQTVVFNELHITIHHHMEKYSYEVMMLVERSSEFRRDGNLLANLPGRRSGIKKLL